MDDALALTPAAALAALAFLIESGADETLADAPVDRLAAARLPERQDSPAAEAPRRMVRPAPALAPPPAPLAAARSAREIASACQSLEELRAALAAFEGCPLKATATQLVFADGNPDAPLMLIGEAPGREEDMAGRPFVGASGQLLDRALAAAGFDRSRVYIANVLYWRPPGNRDPTPEETAVCLPFLTRQIELVRPRVLLTLGAIAARQILGTTDGITRARGKWGIYRPEDLAIPVLATFHPANLLRSPLNKRLVWRDLLAVAARIADS